MILVGLVATTLIVAAISQGRVRIAAAGMMLPVLLVRTDFEFPLGGWISDRRRLVHGSLVCCLVRYDSRPLVCPSIQCCNFRGRLSG